MQAKISKYNLAGESQVLSFPDKIIPKFSSEMLADKPECARQETLLNFEEKEMEQSHPG